MDLTFILIYLYTLFLQEIQGNWKTSAALFSMQVDLSWIDFRVNQNKSFKNEPILTEKYHIIYRISLIVSATTDNDINLKMLKWIVTPLIFCCLLSFVIVCHFDPSAHPQLVNSTKLHKTCGKCRVKYPQSEGSGEFTFGSSKYLTKLKFLKHRNVDFMIEKGTWMECGPVLMKPFPLPRNYKQLSNTLPAGCLTGSDDYPTVKPANRTNLTPISTQFDDLLLWETH